MHSHYNATLRLSAAKDNNITHAATAARSLDATTLSDLQRLSCKAQCNRNTTYARSRSSEEPRRSHSPAICRGLVAKRNITTHNGHTYCSSPKRKKDDFGTLFKGIFKRKIISVKMQKHLVPKHHLQASCSHYNTTYGSQLQKTIVLRTQPQQSQGVDATTLPRSAETELQSTIAQHQQQETKGHLETSVPDSTAKRRRPQLSRKRGHNSPQRRTSLPEKTRCFVQILTNSQITSLMYHWCNSFSEILFQVLLYLAHANWTWWSFELLLYFRHMPTGLNDLWSYFSTSGTCQLDLMIFGATSLLQAHANWT